MKRTIALIIALAAALTMSGCGGETDSAENETFRTTAAVTESEKEETEAEAEAEAETTAAEEPAGIIEPPAEEFKYHYDAALKGVVIDNYEGEAEGVRIPTELDGDPVVQFSIKSNYNIKQVEIPDVFTTIGTSAFLYCGNLESITIPDSVTEIGNYAFSDCASLTEITIPNSVTTIGEQAFRLCKSLESVTISDGVTTIGQFAFNNCINLKNVNIPDSVTALDAGVFSHCESLRSLTLPDGIKSVEDNAFNACDALTVTYKGKEYNYTNWEELSNDVAANNQE